MNRNNSAFQLRRVASQAKRITGIKRRSLVTAKAVRVMLALLLTGACAATAWAQGDIPSGTWSSSGSGPSYTYNLAFIDSSTATSPIGSVWYGWVPFQFFLPGTPTTASAPAGWTASINANSVEFTASSSAFDIMPGHSLSGFSYTATFTPAQLASTPNSGESDAYIMGIETDAGKVFTVQPAPEPSVLTLLSMGLGLWWARRRSAA